jgi:hypothetical protein
MWITLVGAAITLTLNILWIPSASEYFGGFMGSAWATLICYGVMMVISYFTGQRHYYVPYEVARLSGYALFAIALYFAGTFIDTGSTAFDLVLRNAIVLLFAGTVFVMEKPLQMLRK